MLVCYNVWNHFSKIVTRSHPLKQFSKRKLRFYSSKSNLPTDWGSTRLKIRKLESKEAKKILLPLQKAVKEQEIVVKQLKDSEISTVELDNAIQELKEKTKELEATKNRLLSDTDKEKTLHRMKDLLTKGFFYVKSCEIYNGLPGFYDFGPLGHLIKQNLLDLWRQFFVLEEQMLEVETSTIIPEMVLKASGHVNRFSDFLVRDERTNEFYRFDHLLKDQLMLLLDDDKTSENDKLELENILSQLNGMNKEEMMDIARKFSIKFPSGNDLSTPEDFNLMFDVTVGPTLKSKGYLRPELAQGIFVNFEHLLDFNQGRLPFAVAQIGNVFRNELNPQLGLIRVREFMLAEFEHFLDPMDKDFSKFSDIENIIVSLLPSELQTKGIGSERMTIAEALDKKIFHNQSLAYFIGRTQLFLQLIGIDEDRLRFRQHKPNEMAHYAVDCWDAECETYYGWIECVGCADRSCYDLSQHSEFSDVQLSAKRIRSKPLVKEVRQIIPNGEIIRKHFNKNSNKLIKILSSLDEEALLEVENQLLKTGEYKLSEANKEWLLTAEMISVKTVQKNILEEKFIPHVIELSFGIARIMQSLFEHTFTIRENDEKRTFFALPSHVAPIKCAILPLSTKPEFNRIIQLLVHQLKQTGINYRIFDGRGSIGRRYTVSDQFAIPLGITIDYDSLKEPHTATLRNRDTTQQLRIPLNAIPKVAYDIMMRKMSWEDVMKIYPVFHNQPNSEGIELKL